MGTSIGLALAIHVRTSRLEHFLEQECLQVQQQGYSNAAIVSFVDLGLHELDAAFVRCRTVRPYALTLDDCPEFDRQIDTSGSRREDLVHLERHLEDQLQCSGL